MSTPAKEHQGQVVGLDMEPDFHPPVKAEVDGFLTMLSAAATSKDVDVEKLRELLAMKDRELDRRALLDFNQAMQAVQFEIPRVGVNKDNPQTKSMYVTLTKLNKVVVPIYTKHGFSLSFGTKDCPIEKHIRVTCRVAHVGGHFEDYQADYPLDIAGIQGSVNKTPVHAHGSTLSYARRYLTLLIFNITITTEDDDGNGGDQRLDYVTADQVANIKAKLDELGRNPEEREAAKTKFLKFVKAQRLEDILARSYDTCIREIEARIRQRESGPK